MYEFVKMAFYIYLYYLKGATFIYETLLSKYVQKLVQGEKKIKEKVESVINSGTGSSVNSNKRNE